MEQYLIDAMQRALIEVQLQQQPPIEIIEQGSGVYTSFQSAILLDGKVYYCTSKVPSWHKAYLPCRLNNPSFVGDPRA